MELIIGLFGLIFLLFKFGGEKAALKESKQSVDEAIYKKRRFESIIYDEQYELEVEKYIFENKEDAVALAKSIYPGLNYTSPKGVYKDLIKMVLMSQHGKAPKYLMTDSYQSKFVLRHWTRPGTIFNLIFISEGQYSDTTNALQDIPYYNVNSLCDQKSFCEVFENFVRWYDRTMQSNGVPGYMIHVRNGKRLDKSGYPETYLVYYPVSETSRPVERYVLWKDLLSKFSSDVLFL